MKNKRIETKGVIIAIILVLSVSIVVSTKSVNNGAFNASLDDRSGEPIWIYDSDLYIKHVETADLNGDNVADVIAAEYDNTYYYESSKIYAIDGTDGSTLWTYQLNDGVRSMTIGDINNDGVMDVVAGAGKGSPTPDGRVHAIDGTDGSSLWIFTPGGTGDTNGDVAIGNFNGDAYLDVAVACWDDYVYAIDGQTGTQLWSTLIGSIFVNAVDTGDVNGDGIDDVAFAHSYLAGWNNYQGVLDGTDGSTIWMQTVLYKVENVIMTDIDDDGFLEAVFGVTTDADNLEIHVRTAANGNLEWSYTIGSASMNPDAFMFAEDIDNDDDLDLIVGNEWVNFYIYAFDGDSSTPMWISEQLSGYARDIAFGDVTGDGNLNIIAATYDRVQILEAINGTKTWYYSVAGTIATVSSADLDSDGIIDVIAGGSAETSGSPPNPGKSVWALKTVQSPLLWEFNFGEYGNALAIDNLNGDQFMDVVTVCSLDDKATAIDGEDGTELWNWVGTENLYAVTTGDFNNDGQVDVAVGGNDDRVTALYGNNGNVMWQFTNTGNQIYRKCLQTADLNNDGNIDVIAGCDDSSVYAINGLNGNQLWSCYVGAAVNEVELAQMDASGPMDVVVAVGSGTNGEKVVVINGSNGNIQWSYNAPEAVEHVEVLDVNSDNVPDVAAAITPFTPKQIIMIDGSTHTSLWTKPLPISSNVHSLAHGDFNGDNIPDVVVPGSSDDRVYALNGINGNELWNYLTGGEINTVAVADVDSDNLLDVVAGSDDQNVYVINGNGSLTWSYSTADDVMHIQLGDISGDGIPNIACVTFGSDGIAYAFKSFSPAPNLPPYIPSNPSPPDGATYVDPDADLSWDGGDPNPGDTVTYDVHFGTTSPPPKVITNQSGTTYDPGNMGYTTQYYWKIVAWDNHNVSADGPIWEFTTEGANNPPNTPSNPNPPDGAVSIDINADLTWDGGDPNPGDTVTYDVYFGTTSPPPLAVSGQSGTTYDPGTMSYDQTYYWKIVSWDNHGASTAGPEWNFTTETNYPPVFGSPTPANGSGDQPLSFTWSIPINDPEGDNFDWNIDCSNGQSNGAIGDTSGTKTLALTDLSYSTTYTVWVNATDPGGSGLYIREWFTFTTEDEPPKIPDLDCSGTLSWTGVTPGDIVTGSITVENIGDPGSLLDWEIESYPEWGTWTFDPENGEGLTPEDDPITVNIEVVAPDDPETEFTGEVILINSEDPDDTCIIDVSLATPVSQQVDIHPLFQRILEWFPNAFPILRHLLSL